jgi:hypothetical protein
MKLINGNFNKGHAHNSFANILLTFESGWWYQKLKKIPGEYLQSKEKD